MLKLIALCIFCIIPEVIAWYQGYKLYLLVSFVCQYWTICTNVDGGPQKIFYIKSIKIINWCGLQIIKYFLFLTEALFIYYTFDDIRVIVIMVVVRTVFYIEIILILFKDRQLI
jgi:hypothetical protein